MNHSKILVFILVLLAFGSCKKDDSVATINQDLNLLNSDYWGIDSYHKIIVYNGNETTIDDHQLQIGNTSLDIDSDDQNVSIGKTYPVKYKGNEYLFFYTELPILSITTDEQEIVNEPKIYAQLKLLENSSPIYQSDIGIELRGYSSQSFPKKSYNIELWEDETGDDKEKISLLEMRTDDDWILDGMWNEPNRIRDFTAHDLWLDMARVQQPNEDTKLGINRKYCELFIDGHYKGVYYLGEKVDRKQLDLEESDNELEGELYKGYTWTGGVIYSNVIAFDNYNSTWHGYEAKYPKKVGEIDWTNLHKLIDYVVHSTQSDFNANIASKIDMQNAADYFIFLNMIYAPDNRGKNVYTGKLSKSSPYFFVAWDMDGTFGNNWKGERESITNKMLSNGLYNKLLLNPDFKQELKLRWNELRGNVLDNENLKNRFKENNDYLIKNGIHTREALIPGLTQNFHKTEIDFIGGWIDRRITFLDNYFSGL